MSELVIYSASAGSGKTFTLAVEYIKLLLRTRREYRHILAVTFTNKATAEMKARILEELNNLATGNQTNATIKISEEIGMAPDKLRKEADLIKKSLLHDYSRFSIGTIDNFFQRILTSFARETGLQFGFNLELDNKRILELAVDKLLDELEEKSSLSKWLTLFAENRIDEGRSWDFKSDLINLGLEIFSENYQMMDDRRAREEDTVFLSKLKEYQSDLYRIIKSVEHQFKKFGNEFLNKIKERSLEISDFKHGKAGVAQYFSYLVDERRDKFQPGKRVLATVENPDEWVKKTSEKKDEIISLAGSDLNRILNNTVEYFNKNYKDYYTALSIAENLFSYGILTDIEKHIREITHDENLFLLSDVPQFLNKIINGNEAPFIYEKTGNNFKYFMIDEFQDTSRIQWENFKPLVINSISEGNRNMLVGDIKQSIYRWRNSDWRILSSLVNQGSNRFSVDKRTLKKNWRSRRNIVEFNNKLFDAAKILLDNYFENVFQTGGMDEKDVKELITGQTISDVFTAHQQDLPERDNMKGGYAEISFIKNSKDWEEKVLEELPELINNLMIKGIKPGEIAILVRTKAQAVKVIRSLIGYINSVDIDRKKYNLVSDDSLLIKNSAAVNFILCTMRYYFDQNDNINNARLIYYINELNSREKEDINEINELFEADDPGEKLRDMFPEEFNLNLPDFRNLPLFELTENIIRIFKLNTIEEEIPFLVAFQDMVIEYSDTESPGIMGFLEWWDQKGEEKNIALSEKLNAVRILTLHKAKGLQFNTVIVPFCSWKMDHSKNPVLWCKPQTHPFNKFEQLPVKYKKDLSLTEFGNYYYREQFYSYIDNLNLLYVAFTRAESNLFIVCKQSKNNEYSHVGQLVEKAVEYNIKSNRSNSKIKFIEQTKNEKRIIRFGDEVIAGTKSKPDVVDEIAVKEYPSFKYTAKLRFNPQSADYFNFTLHGKRSKVNYGKIMHEIFENIKTTDDIKAALKKLVYAGKITTFEQDQIKNNIYEKLKNEQVKDWFSSKWNVKAEADILLKNGKIRRPDRVIFNDEKTIVIDYKFGDVKEQKHVSQIKRYMHYLAEMGYRKTEGYVWYAEINEIVRV